jgi:hypothetical protein
MNKRIKKNNNCWAWTKGLGGGTTTAKDEHED